MTNASSTAESILRQAPIVPTITIDTLDDAVDFARALVEGGLRVLEITLRTPVALQAIERIARDVPEAIVGAGTVLDREHYQQVINAGAVFAISPGASDALLAANDSRCPFIPGVATASELMRGLSAGHTCFKFFPAEAAGGPSWLKAIQGPFPQAHFCPTGGIDAAKAPGYLTLPNVLTVGGSWMLEKAAIAARDWDRIRKLAAEAARLRVS